MRTLLICALCATLIGCSSPPRRMVERCTSQGCFVRTAATKPTESKRTAFRPEPTKTAAKSKKRAAKYKKIATSAKPTAAKPRNEGGPVEEKAKSGIMEPDVPPSAQPSPTPDRVPDKATAGGKTEIPESGQPPEPPDPVLEKAKVTVAAKMENPASAEFVDIGRATRKNTSGSSLEIVCGHVKGKKKSGEATGERPFLYLVKADEAYIVDRGPDLMAAIVYRAHCTSAR